MSCITVSLIGLFAVYKLIALATIEDYRVQKDLYVQYYEATEPFGHENNFAMAMGITDYVSGE